jgi:cadmium resistance protein CadD (predicted permease)
VRGLVALARRHPDGEAEANAAAGVDGDGDVRKRRWRPHTEQRAVGRSVTAAALVTIAAGGDNLAVYIPLFRVGGAANVGAIVAVFVVGEALVTWVILAGGRHPKARGAMVRMGHVAVPILLCCVGVLVLVQAGTFSLR